MFDDPRVIERYLTVLHGDSGRCDDWKAELISRINAGRLMKKCSSVGSGGGSTSLQLGLGSQDLTDALQSLLSTIRTLFPFPSDRTTVIGAGEISDPTVIPIFPPLINLLASIPPSPDDHVQLFESRSARWLESVFRGGLPVALTKRLLANPGLLSGNGGQALFEVDLLSAPEVKDWQHSEQAKLFYRLVCHTGFIPVRGLAEDLLNDATLLTSPSESYYPTENEQCSSARCMARRTVYDLRFLRPDRLYGPFMVQSSDAHTNQPAEDGLRRSLRLARVNQEAEDEANDPDYVYNGSTPSSDEDEDDSPDEADIYPLVNLITADHRTGSPSQFPSSDTLKPDWTWLAGARIVVEANLQDMMASNNPQVDGHAVREFNALIESMKRMEGLRMGGAPKFWNEEWPGVDTKLGGGGSIDEKGKGKSKALADEERQGWDWAGVTGLWK